MKREDDPHSSKPTFWATVLDDGSGAGRGSVSWLEWINIVAFIALLAFLWSRDLQRLALALALPGWSFWVGHRRSCLTTLLFLAGMAALVVYLSATRTDFGDVSQLQVAAYMAVVIACAVVGKIFRVYLFRRALLSSSR